MAIKISRSWLMIMGLCCVGYDNLKKNFPPLVMNTATRSLGEDFGDAFMYLRVVPRLGIEYDVC